MAKRTPNDEHVCELIKSAANIFRILWVACWDDVRPCVLMNSRNHHWITPQPPPPLRSTAASPMRDTQSEKEANTIWHDTLLATLNYNTTSHNGYTGLSFITTSVAHCQQNIIHLPLNSHFVVIWASQWTGRFVNRTSAQLMEPRLDTVTRPFIVNVACQW